MRTPQVHAALKLVTRNTLPNSIDLSLSHADEFGRIFSASIPAGKHKIALGIYRGFNAIDEGNEGAANTQLTLAVHPIPRRAGASPEFNLTFDALHDAFTTQARKPIEITAEEERQVEDLLERSRSRFQPGLLASTTSATRQESVDSPQVRQFRRIARAVLPRLKLVEKHDEAAVRDCDNAVKLLKYLFIQDRNKG